MSEIFTTLSHGKWILSGEHAVIRGTPALAYPIKTKVLKLTYKKKSSGLSADFFGDHADDIHLLFWSVIEHALELKKLSLHKISGHFTLENSLPIGVGLGASAALCVAVARWFCFLGLTNEQELYSFAKQLEDLFHNKSSGLDIAVCLNSRGIYFQEGVFHPIPQQWQPQWYLSFSGHIGITAHCVKKVQALFETDINKAQRLDNEMRQSVESAFKALQMQKSNGLPLLISAIERAEHCFSEWGLIDKHVQAHIAQLKEAGALAAKPTGSGDGGYILSLWEKEPPQAIQKDLIAI